MTEATRRVLDEALLLSPQERVLLADCLANSLGDAQVAEPTIGQELAALGRSFEGQPCDLPPDLAAQHDHYLHGLPKR